MVGSVTAATIEEHLEGTGSASSGLAQADPVVPKKIKSEPGTKGAHQDTFDLLTKDPRKPLRNLADSLTTLKTLFEETTGQQPHNSCTGTGTGTRVRVRARVQTRAHRKKKICWSKCWPMKKNTLSASFETKTRARFKRCLQNNTRVWTGAQKKYPCLNWRPEKMMWF